jgi:hypothetical protein
LRVFKKPKKSRSAKITKRSRGRTVAGSSGITKRPRTRLTGGKKTAARQPSPEVTDYETDDSADEDEFPSRHEALAETDERTAIDEITGQPTEPVVIDDDRNGAVEAVMVELDSSKLNSPEYLKGLGLVITATEMAKARMLLTKVRERTTYCD